MSRMPWRTRVFVALLERLARRPIETMTLDDIRAARALVNPRGRLQDRVTGFDPVPVDIATENVTARDGHGIPVRVYHPRGGGPDDGPVLMYFHGGGWVQGNAVNYDPLCTHLCHELQVTVVSVDYRLAPEWRAPTAVEDCVDATLAWRREVMAVCGDSAGGNLSAVVAQVLRDRGDSPLRFQALIYPATDMTLQSPSLTEHAEAPILTLAGIHAFADHYQPDREQRANPLVSPLFGRLDGLPPALIQTADLDPIRDDGSRYAAALEAHSIAVTLTNYLGAPHGFASFPGATKVGRPARAELVRELRRHLVT